MTNTLRIAGLSLSIMLINFSEADPHKGDKLPILKSHVTHTEKDLQPIKTHSLSSCIKLIRKANLRHNQEYKPTRVNIMSWNIHKLKNQRIVSELKNNTDHIDLFFFQEAFESPYLSQLRAYSSFAPGYSTKKYTSGVMTVSKYPILAQCQLTHSEPWLQTQKATSITLMNINGHILLSANIHAINFTLGTNNYSQQIQSTMDIIAAHNGPVILAGDLNTWSKKRLKLVNEQANTLNLKSINFNDDHRTMALGNHLDHIFTRDVDIHSSRTEISVLSDHNPLFVTLDL